MIVASCYLLTPFEKRPYQEKEKKYESQCKNKEERCSMVTTHAHKAQSQVSFFIHVSHSLASCSDLVVGSVKQGQNKAKKLYRANALSMHSLFCYCPQYSFASSFLLQGLVLDPFVPRSLPSTMPSPHASLTLPTNRPVSAFQ